MQRVQDLRLDFGGDLLAVLIVAGAGLRRHGEALGHRQADIGHLRQVGTFAAQQIAHAGVALFKQVYVFCHVPSSFKGHSLSAQGNLP